MPKITKRNQEIHTLDYEIEEETTRKQLIKALEWMGTKNRPREKEEQKEKTKKQSLGQGF